MNEKQTDKEKFIEGFRVAPCTYFLVAINIIVFFSLEFLGGSTNTEVMMKNGAINANIILGFGEWYRLFTAMFMHFGMEHLLNNMLLLFFMGQIFEKAVGSIRFTAIYLAAGLTGSFLTFLNQCITDRSDVIAGASGAIFGIVGGMIVVVIINKGRYEGISTKRMVLMALLSLYFGFVTAGTDNVGHIGGFISGAVYTVMLYGIPELMRRLKDRIR